MYLDKKTLFIAGATGSVGTAVIRHVIESCPDTTIVASYRKTKPLVKNKRIIYRKADLRKLDDCRKAVKGCDCAVMAAASTYGSASTTSRPHLQVNDNLLMNAQMLYAFNLEKIKRAIYIGSSTLYQEFEGSIKEDQLDLNKDPHAAYYGIGWVVRYIEKLCNFWHKEYGIEILIARASNIFGPYSKFNNETATFIPAIIRKAVDKNDPFMVWGSPDVVRDVIYTEDFARSVTAMLNKVNIKFDIFNIGSGQKTTVRDVVKLSLKASGHIPSKIEFQTDKPSTIKFRALDITKAKSCLGWEPMFSVQKAIEETTKWWINNKGVWKK